MSKTRAFKEVPCWLATLAPQVDTTQLFIPDVSIRPDTENEEDLDTVLRQLKDAADAPGTVSRSQPNHQGQLRCCLGDSGVRAQGELLPCGLPGRSLCLVAWSWSQG